MIVISLTANTVEARTFPHGKICSFNFGDLWDLNHPYIHILFATPLILPTHTNLPPPVPLIQRPLPPQLRLFLVLHITLPLATIRTHGVGQKEHGHLGKNMERFHTHTHTPRTFFPGVGGRKGERKTAGKNSFFPPFKLPLPENFSEKFRRKLPRE